MYRAARPILAQTRYAATATSSPAEVNWDAAKPFAAIPGPRPLPLVGNAWRLLNVDLHKLNRTMHERYGEIVHIRHLAPGWHVLNLYDVRDIETLFRNEGPHPIRYGFASMGYYRHVMRADVFGETPNGLMHGQGERWGQTRAVANAILMQTRSANAYVPLVDGIADEFVEYVRTLTATAAMMPAHFLNELEKFVFETVAAIALNHRMRCFAPQPSQRALDAIKHVDDMFYLTLPMDILRTGKLHRKLNTRLWRRYIANHEFFTNLTLELLGEARTKMDADPEFKRKPDAEKTVFERLVEKDQKIAVVMTLDMLIAGIETTSMVCGSTLYYIAKNSSAQAKLRRELVELLPTKTTPLTVALLEEARYLRACIKESMRLAPVSHVTARWTSRDLVLGGYRVPAGTEVNCPHMYLSHMPANFAHPAEFRPERWLRTAAADRHPVNPFVSRPFGFGPRACVGQRIANLELEVFIAKMVRNFAMEWPHPEMRFEQKMLYGIADPLKVVLKEVPY